MLFVPTKIDRVDIGFTGTQKGMSTAQSDTIEVFLEYLVGRYNLVVAHHGDCIGADAQFHDLCLKYGVEVNLHPPIIDDKRAFCENAAVTYDAADYRVRNKAIVECCDMLLATPRQNEEMIGELDPLKIGSYGVRRSGTWTTIRQSITLKKPHAIIFPGGMPKVDSNNYVTYEEENTIP